jgi:hypothetical protein
MRDNYRKDNLLFFAAVFMGFFFHPRRQFKEQMRDKKIREGKFA